MIYAHAKQFYWNEQTCANAAKLGQYECLQYLYQNKCPWDKLTCAHASLHNHINLFRICIELITILGIYRIIQSDFVCDHI